MPADFEQALADVYNAELAGSDQARRAALEYVENIFPYTPQAIVFKLKRVSMAEAFVL